MTNWKITFVVNMIRLVLYHVITAILAVWARTILFIMGWRSIDDKVWTHVSKHKHSVAIFAHTAYADFYILCLYLLANPGRMGFVRVLMKPDPFVYAERLLRAFGCIPAGKMSERDSGSSNRIVTELHTADHTMLLLSPKGTIVKGEWRSGWYHIARALPGPIVVVGLDYERKCALITDYIDLVQPYDESATAVTAAMAATKDKVVKLMYDIVPLIPDEEVISTRPHDVSRRSVVNWNWAGRCVGVIVLFVVSSRLFWPN